MRGTERGTRAPTRLTATLGAVGAVLVVLALGLVLRSLIARLLPGSGFGVDLNAFRFWASNLASQGLNGFYARDFFHDYTPGYLYVLWLVGIVGNAAGGVGDLIKVPPIFADLALGWLAWSMVRELGGRDRLALTAAAVAVLNPVSWFDSVVWGQADAFGVVFLLLGLRALWRDQPERAAVFAVIAAMIKPQLGILIPLVAFVTIRRALWPPRADTIPDEPDADPSGEPGAGPSVLDRYRAWESRTGHPIRIVTTALVGIATVWLLCLPFGLSVFEFVPKAPFFHSGLLEQILSTAGGYPYTTVNAYNPWALVSGDLGYSLANSGLWICDGPWGQAICGSGSAMIGPIAAVYVGSGLMLAVVLVVGIVAARRPRPAHAAGRARRARAGVLRRPDAGPRTLRVSILRRRDRPGGDRVALAGGLPRPVRDGVPQHVRRAHESLLPEPEDRGLARDRDGDPRVGADHRDPGRGQRPGVHLGLRPVARPGPPPFDRRARARVAREPDSAMADTAPAERAAPPVASDRQVRGTAPPAAAGEAGSGIPSSSPTTQGAPLARGASAAVALPTWTPRPSFDDIGVVGWFRSRLNDPPIRPDRSALLRREGGGRLDRLDAFLLVVLFLSTLGLRTFRLAEPYQMHFDEVYHARTATEFLQYWRYGIPHDIYEWTHPHLAKYVMAGGIVLWGGDGVQSTSELDVPVKAVAIEPRQDRGGCGRRSRRRTPVRRHWRPDRRL
jgi:hypothetical protein